MSKKLLIVLVCFFAATAFMFAQEKSESSALPGGYSKISLGMSVDAVKEALKKDGQFGYRGDRDVSLLPGENRILIETDTSRTAPYSYLDKCWFQFNDDKLYIITINMKSDRMDHYSLFKTLCDKYGLPQTLTPSKSTWSNDSVIMTLERPLTIKYTDKQVFDSLRDQSKVNKAVSEQTKESFLEGL